MKLKELLSFDDRINEKLRIHLSSTPVGPLQNKPVISPTDKGPYDKPRGLWYGFGREWIDFSVGEGFRPSRGYIYFVKLLKPDRILRITTEGGMYLFTEKYYERPLIDWKRVAQDWAGIEITPWQGRLYMDSAKLSWYGGWDIASGCVWETSAIKLRQIFPKKDV